MVLGLFTQIFISMEKTAETEKEKKHARYGQMTVMWIGVVLLGLGFLYALGWIWYYFCGGFLIGESRTSCGKSCGACLPLSLLDSSSD